MKCGLSEGFCLPVRYTKDGGFSALEGPKSVTPGRKKEMMERGIRSSVHLGGVRPPSLCHSAEFIYSIRASGFRVGVYTP